MENQVILYQAGNAVKVDVRFERDTVWLTQAQIAALFGVGQAAISKHIRNVYDSEELHEEGTYSILEYIKGNRAYQTKFYNLDVILSVGYRVNSVNATHFRRWATSILREHALGRPSEIRRIEQLESRVGAIEVQLADQCPPKEKIFFAGEIFDAYTFFSDRIREAKRRVIVIDNYVDDRVLTLLDKRCQKVSATIYTGRLSRQLQLDLHRHNEQYAPISIAHYPGVHDRFLIIDKTLYLVGASLKDAGGKTFAVMRMSLPPEAVLPASLSKGGAQ